MKILYYLEPFEERENPLFRLATVRNHLDRETRRLLDNGIMEVEVAMLCSEAVAAAVQQEHLLPRVRLLPVSQDELRGVYPDYLEASARWYNRDYAPEKLQQMMGLCAQKLGSFLPDVILCYESNAPFLESLFPKALFLHNTLGIFSRAPYPETSALDPFGIGKDSYLARFGAELRARTLTDAEEARLLRLKQAYRAAQLEHSPLRSQHVRGKFERVVLLPLQVSRYFVFDENVPSELHGVSQLDLVRHCLDHIDPTIGVCVTMHSAESTLFTEAVLAELRAKHQNFLFSPEIQHLRWASQHVLPHVDAVVSVSSSIGLQALVWDVPLVVLGRSHLTGVASSASLSDLPALVAHKTRAMDGALYHLLTHYYPLLDAYHHRGEWFVRFLERSIAKKQKGLDLSFFDPIDAPETLFDAYVSGLRIELYKKEVSSSVRWGGPTVQMLADDIDVHIADADLVSFDVFDTLVTRPLLNPRSVFDLIAPHAEALLREHGVDVEALGGFAKLRKEAAAEAQKHAQARGVEEYNLDSLYELLCARLFVGRELKDALKELENEAEITLNRARETGARAYRKAIEQNKRVVLLSDMFLEQPVVERILAQAGYRDHHALYLSSSHGLLKRTGKLWEHVRELEKNPKKWVHFGDHRISDVEVPQALGVHTHQLPSLSDLYGATKGVRSAWKPHELDHSLSASIHHGVVSRKFYDRPAALDRVLSFEGSPYRLGFEAGGPIMLSFVLWILEKARRNKITDLYFLARDGHLPKLIYDLVAEHHEGAPRSHYLYASRRAYTVASLEHPSDIIRSLDAMPASMRIGEFLRARFGVEPDDVDRTTLEVLDALSFDDMIAFDEPDKRRKALEFARLNHEPILNNARRERADLLAYFESEGLFDSSRRASVVDIGHNASLQVALSRLTGRRDLEGLYFATYHPAKKHYRQGFDMASYLLEFEDGNASQHVYCKNLYMFEFLFLPAIQSLMRVSRREDGTFEPIFVPGDETKRFELASEVHRGVVDYSREVIRASLRRPWLFDLSKNEATRTYERFVSWPSRGDALLFEGVSFVENYGGVGKRYLIARPALDLKGPTAASRYLNDSWWKPGARALLDMDKQEPEPQSEKPKLSPKQKPELSPWERKVLKLLRDPKGFALDTRVGRKAKKIAKIARKLGR